MARAAELIGRGETVLAMIDPAAERRDPDAFGRWLTARLSIAELPRVMLPDCDSRCAESTHHPDRFVLLADLALDPAQPRRAGWWAGWTESLERRLRDRPSWFAGAPAMPQTLPDRRLTTGTRLRRLTTTDPRWVVYDGEPMEVLYVILDGARAGDTVIAVGFGPAPLLPAFSGALIAPDHPPVRDPAVAVRLVAAGWAAVRRGLPDEE